MTEQEETRLKELCDGGFTAYSGIKVRTIRDGYAEGEIEIQEHHLNPHGTIHGGLLYVLTDTIGGLATRGEGPFVPTTAASSISYLKPTFGTKKLIAKAQLVKSGHSLCVVQTDVYDENDMHLATSTSNYFNIADKVKR